MPYLSSHECPSRYSVELVLLSCCLCGSIINSMFFSKTSYHRVFIPSFSSVYAPSRVCFPSNIFHSIFSPVTLLPRVVEKNVLLKQKVIIKPICA